MCSPRNAEWFTQQEGDCQEPNIEETVSREKVAEKILRANL
jgi:hypothetical protein